MEITAFLDRKLTRRFRTYDADGDDFIGRDDFAGAGERTTKAFGLACDDPKAVRFQHRLIGLWEHLTGQNHCERISLDEYKKAFANRLLETPQSFDEGYVPFLNAVMAIADEDGDGKLTVEQHVVCTGALMDLSEADARMVHDILSDDDELMPVHALLEVIREF